MAAFFMNEETNKAYNYILFLISRQDYPKSKLQKKLSQKGYSKEIIDAVLERISSQGIFDEKRYMDSKIRSLAKRNYSKSHIHKFLKHEDLSFEDSEIDSIFAKEEITEEEQLDQLIDKKIKKFTHRPLNQDEKYQIQKKLFSYLYSKGHNYKKIMTSLTKKLSEI
ncbi:MAG: hypothetical protein A2381_10700 [Bdellovibrionales bacterium RIFOXYB1_FULL_37_110]|nr:MAG: hypothetical protein A2181_06840 [Bdellovibrionales bacterium RIFOXYA1_FULL_38_20]OFZ51133.1 MAG: hypothetical protein A2417_17680 [Bdellovibrionales bacterium RIFOXYC1_FULL_37_79]OFZ54400.1 MAG: hypothetical protein A2328_12110 [Bdellovibrionales bacterium RIFOXYB2_FULL_36_6]OFZ61240.1 MAG: hypothetical protein A2381_10700 [Bdellovibrionales bacterium RIFOXYB1_FULL_37_110]OFZ62103.1 MAG: hypothetical protein A2577_14275 [Bdellovibrionales bacterium RIFOXYD1_FULL_36_51]